MPGARSGKAKAPMPASSYLRVMHTSLPVLARTILRPTAMSEHPENSEDDRLEAKLLAHERSIAVMSRVESELRARPRSTRRDEMLITTEKALKTARDAANFTRVCIKGNAEAAVT